MKVLIPPREPCPLCQGRGSMTYSGAFIACCWGCSGTGRTRDWHTFQVVALQAFALLAASAAGGAFVAFLTGDLAAIADAMAAFVAVTP
ncbi:hypothetical protein ACFOY2_45750 [Nonomuraea purpurea]|uniref:Uncharacterized protein n=1 Tax=Nonomuraea purpurea TaxID=1849276 RepID=A0ABV8GKW2_9ACTN